MCDRHTKNDCNDHKEQQEVSVDIAFHPGFFGSDLGEQAGEMRIHGVDFHDLVVLPELIDNQREHHADAQQYAYTHKCVGE